MNKNVKNVYADFDDVLCSSANNLLDIIYFRYGRRFTYNQITDYDLLISLCLTEKEVSDVLRIIAHTHEQIMYNKPIKNAFKI